MNSCASCFCTLILCFITLRMCRFCFLCSPTTIPQVCVLIFIYCFLFYDHTNPFLLFTFVLISKPFIVLLPNINGYFQGLSHDFYISTIYIPRDFLYTSRTLAIRRILNVIFKRSNFLLYSGFHNLFAVLGQILK